MILIGGLILQFVYNLHIVVALTTCISSSRFQGISVELLRGP